MLLLELSTTPLAEVCHWRILGSDKSSRIEATGKSYQRFFCVVLVAIFYIDVSYHVISKIITDHDRLNIAVLKAFLKHLFVEFFVVLSRVFLRIARWWHIKVGHEQGLGEVRSHMLSRASFSVPAGSDLKVE